MVFYELPEEKADELIRMYDGTDRPVPISSLRSDESISKETVDAIIKRIEDLATNNPFKEKLLNIAGSLVSKNCKC
jgi:hypothetical protein